MFILIPAIISLVLMIVWTVQEDDSRVKKAYAIGTIMALNWAIVAVALIK